MDYHFERKYKDRKDISVLVVEKSINPFDREDTRHDISEIAYFLNGYGFSVDLTWSLSEWKFDKFEDFLGSIFDKFEEKVRKYLGRRDELGEILAEHSKQELNEFKSRVRLLRKKPIKLVEDLDNYNFLIMHPDFDDCDKVLPEILEKYPDKPIILPMGSVAACLHKNHTNDFVIEGCLENGKNN